MTPYRFELTALTKNGGPLTKRISITENGALLSSGSHCVMTIGQAFRLPLADIGALAEVIDRLKPENAIALGRLRPGLQDRTLILTQFRLASADPAQTAIARTKEHFRYEPEQPALALLDFDQKGMPAEVAERINRLGGFEQAVASVLPSIGLVGRLTRASTSAGLYRTDTGMTFPGSGGLHCYLGIRDGGDLERFLNDLHCRLFTAGFGWLTVSKGGQLLERSIIDRVVGSPERLVFEGPPILVPPLAQDAEARRPIAVEGGLLDTVAACPPLTILETSDYQATRTRQAAMLSTEVESARANFIRQQGARIAERTGMSSARAARIVERQSAGVLLPDVILPFDDPELQGVTVGDVLADPERYVDETLADPLEGIDYGRCKAKIMRRASGELWIHSFAHGRTTYELKPDFAAVQAVLHAARPDDAADTFVRISLAADLTASEIERLLEIAARKGGGKRTLQSMLKMARAEAAKANAKQRHEQQLAERCDPRPRVPAPAPDSEWLPVVELLNAVHGRSRADEPPMRNRNGDLVQIRSSSTPSLHMLASGDNVELPPPSQMQIYTLTEPEVAEVIERHIEFGQDTREGWRPVHLGAQFVRHFANRSDGALPIVTGIASLAIVLPDGQLLRARGFDRDSGIVFRIPAAVKLPEPGKCDGLAAAMAMDFLINQWLVDVATDYPGKCILIACALTIIERMALPERPAFFVTAGQRGGGKTTVLHMVATAVLGARAAAAAWSPNDEERRKALFAYLGAGLPFLVWDNIPLGAAINCASIEKALTTETYSDRVLGESRHLEVPAYTIMAFTGNNVTARGDMASRSLSVRLNIDRTDPENREFEHADPIAWTEQHRVEILSALYTILLANPRFAEVNKTPRETRFKAWWHLVGAAVEYAAQQHAEREQNSANRPLSAPSPCSATPIRFRDLFLDGEADDEVQSALIVVLETLRTRFGTWTFQASDIAQFAGDMDPEAIDFRAALELASGKVLPIITSTTIAWRLKAIKDRPVDVVEQTLVLRFAADKRQGGYYSVSTLEGGKPRGILGVQD
ncbi:MAG: hypothetical protein JO001_00210 [Alphaproteobacteria bacterium]|nr:hypothetical protein [Alphaproteobacteria bacterium]